MKVICFDFDGVIAQYDKWEGFDVIGKPIQDVITAMQVLKDRGYYLTIFTTRSDTPTLRKWLEDNKVPYDSLNSNSHNPPMTSHKPIYHCIVDDRALNFNIRSNFLHWNTLVEQIEILTTETEELK